MTARNTDYDAVVVGSGPNGLAAAITLQQAGLSVLLLEAANEIGGGLRSAELTLPHFVHDVCSAIHPLASSSPFFNSLPLARHGLEFIDPTIPVAHPFDGGNAAALFKSVEQTSEGLGEDRASYLKLMNRLVSEWPEIIEDVLGPLRFPKHPLPMLRFGWRALSRASRLARRFSSTAARGLWAGMAAHSVQPFSGVVSSAIPLVLMAIGHSRGWPIAKGGSAAIAGALASHFLSLGGTIETNVDVHSLKQIPSARAILFDVTPRQLLEIAGYRFSSVYKWQLRRFRYGMGVFKIDWALKSPIPFTSPICRAAGTVHVGNTFEEIAAAERLTGEGKHPDNPFVLLAQQSLFDTHRAPAGYHTAWAYCHVPNGSEFDMTTRIERQVERFAPGFADVILRRHVMNTGEMTRYNSNYVGGDIGGGTMDITQLFTRPALRLSPYRTSARGIYICSSSTPPGGGAHGMCGYHAANRVLKDMFQKK